MSVSILGPTTILCYILTVGWVPEFRVGWVPEFRVLDSRTPENMNAVVKEKEKTVTNGRHGIFRGRI